MSVKKAQGEMETEWGRPGDDSIWKKQGHGGWVEDGHGFIPRDEMHSQSWESAKRRRFELGTRKEGSGEPGCWRTSRGRDLQAVPSSGQGSELEHRLGSCPCSGDSRSNAERAPPCHGRMLWSTSCGPISLKRGILTENSQV